MIFFALIVALLAICLMCVTLFILKNHTSAQMQHVRVLQEFVQSEMIKLERNLRSESQEGLGRARLEQSQNFTTLQTMLTQQLAQSAQTQNLQLSELNEQIKNLQMGLSDTLTQQLLSIHEGNARRMAEIRLTLDTQLQQLILNNAQKLEEMRITVDEKLQSTLQERVSSSFKQVADRLEQVHKGLGEMQVLAQGVGDLKHILTNVKTRGTFGETQLEALLEQVLTPEQYQMQTNTHPQSKTVVDAVIKLPGRGDATHSAVLLPIDAKFPTEDYERILAAQEKADPVALETAQRALEQKIKQEAKSISDKYIAPPHTTDFAILFLPSEGLYAEALRLNGVLETIQRDYKIVLAGPANLLAILNSLRMGFRTLAIEKRSHEVWNVLSKVKHEFSKFEDVFEKLKKQAQTVINTVDSIDQRNRGMQKALIVVESWSQSSDQTPEKNSTLPLS